MPAFSAWSVGVTHALPMLASSARRSPMPALPMPAFSAWCDPCWLPVRAVTLCFAHARFSVFGVTLCIAHARFQLVSKAAFVVVVVCLFFLSHNLC